MKVVCRYWGNRWRAGACKFCWLAPR